VQNFIPCLVLSLVVAAPPAALPQGSSTTPVSTRTAQPATAQVPLRVQLVVSRHVGEKKVSSIPYTLSVVANDNEKTSLRMGVELPVARTVVSGEGKSQSSYSYRPVGTNIDCGARSTEAGLFKLTLAVSDSSVFLPDKQGMTMSSVEGVPAFRTFTSSFSVLLRDGQTAQHTAATDPVSGEVLRIDVTVNVLK
jgi:hypothetical protein